MGLTVEVSCNFLFKSDNTTERPIKAPSEWTTVFSKEHRALLFGLGDPDRHHLAANSTPGPQIKKKSIRLLDEVVLFFFQLHFSSLYDMNSWRQTGVEPEYVHVRKGRKSSR